MNERNDMYLRKRGFEVVDRKPKGNCPYVEIRPSDLLPKRYEVWVIAPDDVGFPAEFREDVSMLESIDAVTGFIAETLMETCEIPEGRRIKVFAEPGCRDRALGLPEMYGGML